MIFPRDTPSPSNQLKQLTLNRQCSNIGYTINSDRYHLLLQLDYFSYFFSPEYLSTLRRGDRLPANLDYLRVPAGTRQELVCRISNPRAPIVWEKDGQVLQQIGRGSISAPVFNSITKADSGVYRCVSDDQTYTVLVDVVPQPVQGKCANVIVTLEVNDRCLSILHFI